MPVHNSKANGDLLCIVIKLNPHNLRIWIGGFEFFQVNETECFFIFKNIFLKMCLTLSSLVDSSGLMVPPGTFKCGHLVLRLRLFLFVTYTIT